MKFAWKCCFFLGYSRFYAYACFHQRIVLPWYSFYPWLLSFEVINLEHCCAVVIPFFYRFLTSRNHIFSLFAEYCLLMSLSLCIFGLIIILKDFCQKSLKLIFYMVLLAHFYLNHFDLVPQCYIFDVFNILL